MTPLNLASREAMLSQSPVNIPDDSLWEESLRLTVVMEEITQQAGEPINHGYDTRVLSPELIRRYNAMHRVRGLISRRLQEITGLDSIE
jgi:hypothetical protein